MLVSCPFLIATFIVYAANKELRNLHGKSLMCYSMCLTICFFCWALVIIFQPNLLNIPDLCEASGYFIYFWLLTTFLWLNVMCYDIFSTFRREFKKRNRHRVFLSYCLYAFGIPILITAMTFCIDRFTTINDKFKAGMGDKKCYFRHEETELIYVFTPLSIIFAVNIGLFVFVAIKIHAAKKASKNVIQRGEGQMHSTSNDQ